eukprot:SAG31_NODE_771_length_12216_cov_5.603862_3_plen_38_part_00
MITVFMAFSPNLSHVGRHLRGIELVSMGLVLTDTGRL